MARRVLEDAAWSDGIRALKVLLASEHSENFDSGELRAALDGYIQRHGAMSGITVDALTAIYLAYVFRLSRKAIAGQHEYLNKAMDLAFNVCVPIEHVEANPIRQAFERVLLWAELLERDWPMNSAVDWLMQNHCIYSSRTTGGERRSFLIPESVAQAASYVSSLRRRPGLHALIDLGAGTTDVSVFNLAEDRLQEHSYWYSSGNLPIGTLEVERFLSRNGSDERSFAEVAVAMERLSADAAVEPLRRIREHLEKVFEQAKRVWSAAYNHLRRESPWHSVEVFLCGGGAGLPGVAAVFSEPWWVHLRNHGVRYSVNVLPEPDDYDSLNSSAPFLRMAVAYGLSFPAPLLGGYTLPGDCPDQTPPDLPMRPTLGGEDGGRRIPSAGWV